jgi:hypothetical protein
MFTPAQYRDQAAIYHQRARTAQGAKERREFSDLARSFAVLGENEQWLVDNQEKTARAAARGRS